MFELEYLVNSLKENKNVSYFRSKRIIKRMAFEYIRRLGYSEPNYKLNIDFVYYKGYDTDVLGECSEVKNNKVNIKFNTMLIDGLNPGGYENFDRTDMFVILFHELEHVRQAKMFETGGILETEDLYKDKVLKEYFSENKKNPYYHKNYKVITEEVLANIAGVKKTIEFFQKYGIELTKEELNKLNNKLNENLELLNNKERINPLDSKKYELDELYNMILSNEVGRKR